MQGGCRNNDDDERVEAEIMPQGGRIDEVYDVVMSLKNYHISQGHILKSTFSHLSKTMLFFLSPILIP